MTDQLIGLMSGGVTGYLHFDDLKTIKLIYLDLV